MEVLKLSNAIGAEIRGINLADPLDKHIITAIEQAWAENIVLLFRGQDMGLEDQTRFASYFGVVAKHFRPKKIRNEAKELGPNVMLVSNVRENGRPIGSIPDGEMLFHSDTPYVEHPDKYTTLYALEVPAEGGNTIFGNCYLAAETLPVDVIERLLGRKALHVFEYGAVTKTEKFNRKKGRYWEQPVFRKHPVTGRTSLYVSELMTEEILGLAPEESDQLLDFLFKHQRKKCFQYEHVWQVGDLLAWDNRCSIHGRTDFSRSERRTLRRLTIEDETRVLMGNPLETIVWRHNEKQS